MTPNTMTKTITGNRRMVTISPCRYNGIGGEGQW